MRRRFRERFVSSGSARDRAPQRGKDRVGGKRRGKVGEGESGTTNGLQHPPSPRPIGGAVGFISTEVRHSVVRGMPPWAFTECFTTLPLPSLVSSSPARFMPPNARASTARCVTAIPSSRPMEPKVSANCGADNPSVNYRRDFCASFEVSSFPETGIPFGRA